MVKPFSPRLEILPRSQRQLWHELAGVPGEFVLYGGTALALHLGHRESIDFDLFACQDIDTTNLLLRVPFLAGSRIIQREPNTLTCLVERGDSIKVSFFGLPHMRPLRDPHICTDIKLGIASLIDLAAAKVSVVQQRAQAKDYIDIYALIAAGVSLARALAAAKLVFGPSFAPNPTLKALSYFGEGDLASIPDDVKRSLVHQVTVVDPLRLPILNRTAGLKRPSSRARKT